MQVQNLQKKKTLEGPQDSKRAKEIAKEKERLNRVINQKEQEIKNREIVQKAQKKQR